LLTSTFSAVLAERHKNITYLQQKEDKYSKQKHLLDVYSAQPNDSKSEVLVFIHGGSWKSGNKNLYKFLGNKMAKKGVVTVVINYRLHPNAKITGMIKDCAHALKWVYENIETHGGNKNKIFVSGHSAGGHLAALLSVQDAWFDSLNIPNPVAGCILIDAFALDMHDYLSKNPNSARNSYFTTFSNNPEIWKTRSPINHVNSTTPPTMIYAGARTYPSILTGSQAYYQKLQEYKVKTSHTIIKNKKHIPMITQFMRKGNPLYEEIITFMEQNG